MCTSPGARWNLRHHLRPQDRSLQFLPSLRRGLDLFRVPHAHQRPGLPTPATGDGDLFGGSLFDLTPATDYDVRLTLDDPDGGGTSRVVSVRTWSEPQAPAPRRTLHVRPGRGGGNGAAGDPFLGLAAADAGAQPGDLLLLHAGSYRGGVNLQHSGTADAPIVWRAAGDGEAIIAAPRDGVGIKAPGLAHVFLEGLTVRGGERAMTLNDGRNITIRRCRFAGCGSGIWAAGEKAARFFIADCTFEGPRTWPRPKNDVALGESRGVEIGGLGSVVAWNRFRGYRDAVDTIGGPPVRSIDICHNDIQSCTDDGVELDYSDRNCRVFRNRIVDCHMGISFQPSFGGPNYAVRNFLYNLGLETFKLHVSPPGVMTAGGVLLHNTVVMRGVPLRVWASYDCRIRSFTICNNLFAAYEADWAIDLIGAVDGLSLDGNLYAGGPFGSFARIGTTSHPTWNLFRAESGYEANGRLAADAASPFADMPPPPGAEHRTRAPPRNWQPAPTGPAIDGGVRLPGINDGSRGHSPDIGALEAGDHVPVVGPRDAAARKDAAGGLGVAGPMAMNAQPDVQGVSPHDHR
jgi:hypothetical protein